MRTYKITYILSGFPGVKIKYIPSFSPEEAKAEFLWLMQTCYDCKPQIISIEEMPKNGG